MLINIYYLHTYNLIPYHLNIEILMLNFHKLMHFNSKILNLIYLYANNNYLYYDILMENEIHSLLSHMILNYLDNTFNLKKYTLKIFNVYM